MGSGNSVLLSALIKMLTPLVRVLLRNGVAFHDFAEVTKQVYVDVANKEFATPGRKQSLTNVAVLTGIHRHEVKRMLAEPASSNNHAPRHNRAARVINGWISDEDFSTDGVPRPLRIADEFNELIARHGGDATPRSILDELRRIGAVERGDDESLSLTVAAYVPRDSDEDMVRIFGDCVADLIETVGYNLSHTPEEQRLQISVVHDNLPDDVISNLELIARDKSMEFLTDMNNYFETQDRDGNPNVQGTGRNRAGIGLYFFRQSLEKD